MEHDRVGPRGPSQPRELGSGAGAPRQTPGRSWDGFLCPQVVGNLLYYRFLNPAVVAPDAFDIVAMAAGGALATSQRHALGAVAQVLQHAAAGKAFSEESRHLQALNDYLEETHLKFRSVPSPPPPAFCRAPPASLQFLKERRMEVKRVVSEPESGLLEGLPSGLERTLGGWGGLLGTAGGNRAWGVLPAPPLPYPSSGDRRFVCRACQVPEPEERFAMDEYSDMVAVAKPVVYITVGELVNTHRVRGAAGGRWGDRPSEERPTRACICCAALTCSCC